MSKSSGFALAIASALALVFGAPSALALSYTVPVAVHMDDGGAGVSVLDILPVFDDTGSTSCLAGDCGGADRLVFDVSVTAGAFEELLAVAQVVAPLGLGYYTDSETAPSTGGLVGLGGRFDFDAPNLSGAGNRLFISYADLSSALTTQFSATPAGGLIFSQPGGIVPIPEPGSLTLCALGLVGLAAARRRNRTRI